MATKNIDANAEVKTMEYSTIRAPYEMLNKNYRNTQKTFEKEFSSFNLYLTNIEKGDDTPVNFLKTFTDKLQKFKRKADQFMDNEQDEIDSCKQRLTELMKYSSADEEYTTPWKRRRLNRIIIEHLIYSGYYGTAMKVAEDSAVWGITNLEIGLYLKDIEQTLKEKKVDRCIEWCQENRSKLRRLKSNLEVNLRKVKFITLIKEGKRMDALQYAKTHFAKHENVKYIQQLMALLIFPCNIKISPYKQMLIEDWDQLIKEFKVDSAKIYGLGTESVLSAIVEAGISCLKTPFCSATGKYRNKDCPVCNKTINKLGLKMPFSHNAQSKMFCRISFEPMDEYNFPFMLPNGQVYGFNALEKMAQDNEGVIICPTTKDSFDFRDIRRVFIM